MPKDYADQMANIASRAHEMRKTLLDPVIDDNGEVIADAKVRGERLENAVSNTIYESAGENAGMIVGAHSRALRAYAQKHGRLPEDEVLASVHNAVQNALSLKSRGAGSISGIFEGAGDSLSTTEGVMMRDRMVSLVLPVTLQSITTNMITLIPGQFNKSELFRVYRVAGSTFGDLKTGEKIDYKYNGRYTVMDQRVKMDDGNGAATQFRLDTNTKFGKVYPLKRGSITIMHDHNIVARDNGSGAIVGAFTVDGAPVTVTGTVDYAGGVIDPTFSVAPKNNIEIHIGFDVSIEKDATLIPRIDHNMDSRTLIPHESAIAGNVTLQALWAMRRELGVDIDNMAMAGMRNLLSADKDRKILRDLYFYARDTQEWVYEGPDSITMKEHYETLNAALLAIDSQLMQNTGVSGLVGLVGDSNACNVFRYLPAPLFVPAPGYRSVPQPHYVGRVFGQWDLYCDPQQEEYTCLAFARGPEHGQTGYVAGDAVPAMSFRHPILGDLVTNATMWELAYRDLQPFDGRDYLMKLKMTQA